MEKAVYHRLFFAILAVFVFCGAVWASTVHNGNDTASIEAVIRQELRRQQGRGQTYDVRVIGVEDVGQERIATYLLGGDEDWNQEAGYAAFFRTEKGDYRYWMHRQLYINSGRVWLGTKTLYENGEGLSTGVCDILVCNDPKAVSVEWQVNNGPAHTLDIPQVPCMLLLDLSELPANGGRWRTTVYDADGNELL